MRTQTSTTARPWLAVAGKACPGCCFVAGFGQALCLPAQASHCISHHFRLLLIACLLDFEVCHSTCLPLCGHRKTWCRDKRSSWASVRASRVKSSRLQPLLKRCIRKTPRSRLFHFTSSLRSRPWMRMFLRTPRASCQTWKPWRPQRW